MNMDIIQTDRTYATRENALKHLKNALSRGGLTLDDARWMIATNAEGRFAPVLCGQEYIPYALHFNITVTG
jgi:hypothetical protein